MIPTIQNRITTFSSASPEFEMMMQRSHFEYPFPLGRLEERNLEKDGQGSRMKTPPTAKIGIPA